MTYLLVSNDPVRLTADVLAFAKTYNPSDVFWVKRNADKKEITVDVVNTMVAQANLASVSGKKLFIVFEAELLNTAAQNKLLKTIENTDDQTTFLFLCADLNNILSTIKSRSIIRVQHVTDNLTLKELAAANPDSDQITAAATGLLTTGTVDAAIGYLPVLSKPENLPLALAALNQAIKASDRPVTAKLRLYRALALIKRNANFNCNAAMSFDRLLLALF